ncbi:MAG: hypothetical protein P4L65_06920 [Legionella sp.]|nr:hypothetical protein [Legionella sp.]
MLILGKLLEKSDAFLNREYYLHLAALAAAEQGHEDLVIKLIGKLHQQLCCISGEVCREMPVKQFIETVIQKAKQSGHNELAQNLSKNMWNIMGLSQLRGHSPFNNKEP